MIDLFEVIVGDETPRVSTLKRSSFHELRRQIKKLTYGLYALAAIFILSAFAWGITEFGLIGPEFESVSWISIGLGSTSLFGALKLESHYRAATEKLAAKLVSQQRFSRQYVL